MESTLRRTWAEIDLDALAYNYRALRQRVGAGVKFLGVVKADAYGHGAVRVAQTLQELGADYLAVSSADEAMELRENGITMPVLILGGIYSGKFTPTEAAAVSCVYTFIIGTFVYKEIRWKEFVDCMKDTVIIAGATSFIVGMSTSFAYVMTLEQVPETLSAFILGLSSNKIVVLLIMNVFLLIVGMFMDNISSCTILAPILLPVATALGVNPVHFGILMTMNLAVGFITPPYGVNLFVGSSVARIPFERVVKWIWPLIGTILVVLLLTTYVPQLSLLLV